VGYKTAVSRDTLTRAATAAEIRHATYLASAWFGCVAKKGAQNPRANFVLPCVDGQYVFFFVCVNRPKTAVSRRAATSAAEI
jgi:hypothetical protein